MSESIPFTIQEGLHAEAAALYLPFGTRTLRFRVTNQTDRPRKLWLRPHNTPADYRATGLIRGYVDDDPTGSDFWVHWAGGDEVGACVKTDEKDPLRDKTIRIWEVIPVEVEPGESRTVFLNVTHRAGATGPRALTLAAIGEDGGRELLLDSNLKVALNAPLANGGLIHDPVRAVWNTAGDRLTFTGSQIPDYVSRWWPAAAFAYQDAGDLPERLTVRAEGDRLLLALDAAADGHGGTLLAEIKDNDWEPGLDVHRLRPCQPELFHFCGGRYYVVRFWFSWLDTAIGPRHEVPDAERLDLLLNLEEARISYMGTDFHYKETWGRVRPGERVARAELGLGLSSVDDFTLQSLRAFFDKSREINPPRKIARQLCEAFTFQTGPQAHVPTLSNITLFRNITSPDVRAG